jgi:hypothetical protein
MPSYPAFSCCQSYRCTIIINTFADNVTASQCGIDATLTPRFCFEPLESLQHAR